MRSLLVATLCMLLSTALAQPTQPIQRGVTFQATVWPSYENSYTGRFSCNNCNPFEGDQLCSRKLPLLCINHHKTLDRPFYRIAIEYTPFRVVDGGYYDGWTGGVFEVTTPIRGSDVTTYQAGDDICKGFFGNTSKWATFDDGYYMDYMNQRPYKTYNLWNWSEAKQGKWNYWGYFNHHYRGRAWIWIGLNSGNCGA